MDKKQVIQEARGIANSTLPYTEAILNTLNKHIEYFFSKISDVDYLELTKPIRGHFPDYHVKFEIPYRNLARYINNEIFKDFPVAKLIIELKMVLNDEEGHGPESSTGGNFWISGGSWPLYTRANTVMSYREDPEKFPISKLRKESNKRVIVGRLDFDIAIYKNFDIEIEKDVFERELYAIVIHEVQHLYESHKDKAQDVHVIYPEKARNSKKPKTKGYSGKAYLTDTKLIGIPKDLKDLISSLTNLYYWSVPGEVKSITHEMYPFVLSMDIDEFFNSFQGQRIKSMRNFDAEEFYEDLVDKSIEYFVNNDIELNEESMESFFNQIKNRIISKHIKVSKDNNEIIDKKLTSKKDLKSLLKYMNKEIHKGGDRLFRNVGRLYSLKSEIKE